MREDFLLEEYRLAHEELRSLWNLYWRQASYFLTFNAALIAFVSTSVSLLKDYWLVFIISMFGILITLLWLFHGNRFFLYIQTVEKRMIDAEEDEHFIMKLKIYQKDRYSNKGDLSFLEKLPGSKIRNTILPVLVIIIWCTILAYSSYLFTPWR
jgi:hypothetical protein